MKPAFCQNVRPTCKYSVNNGLAVSVDDDSDDCQFCTDCGVPMENRVDVRGSQQVVRLTHIAYDGLRLPVVPPGVIGDSLVSCSECGDLAHISQTDRLCQSRTIDGCKGTYLSESDGRYASRQNADNNPVFGVSKPSSGNLTSAARMFELTRESVSSEFGCAILQEAGVLGILTQSKVGFCRTDCVLTETGPSLPFHTIELPRVVPAPAKHPLACMYAGKFYVFSYGVVSSLDYSQYLSTGRPEWIHSTIAMTHVTAVTSGLGFVACLVIVADRYRLYVWKATASVDTATSYDLPADANFVQPVRIVILPGAAPSDTINKIYVLSAVDSNGANQYVPPACYIIDGASGTALLKRGVVSCVNYDNSAWTVEESSDRTKVALYRDGVKVGNDHDYDSMQHAAGLHIAVSETGPVLAIEKLDSTYRQTDTLMAGPRGDVRVVSFADGTEVTDSLIVRKIMQHGSVVDAIHVWRKPVLLASHRHYAFSKTVGGYYVSDPSVGIILETAEFRNWMIDPKWIGVVVRNQVGTDVVYQMLAYPFA